MLNAFVSYRMRRAMAEAEKAHARQCRDSSSPSIAAH
jgi:hypothetical protein